MTYIRFLSALAAVALIGLSACAKHPESTTTAPVASGAPSSTAVSAADAGRGKTLFAQNCAACHGAEGQTGGVGPALKNEKSRKNTAAVIAQIKNPQPPMAKLYPGTLDEKDVADLAAYVETL